MQEMTRPASASENVRLVSEAIAPHTGTFATEGMAAGEPGVPGKFDWSGTTYTVTAVLERNKSTGPCTHGSGERYVRKHWYRVTVSPGEVTMHLYCMRRAAPGKRRWFLYGIETDTKTNA